MNNSDLKVFNQAVQLANSGHKQKAYQLIKSIAATNQDDSNLLMWLMVTTPDLREAGHALNLFVARDPHNPSIPGARKWLAAEKIKRNLI
jgi:hypothetical protein